MWYLLVPSSGGELHVADKSSSFTACSSLMFFRAIRGALLFKHIFPDAKRPNVFVCSPAQTADFIFTLAAFLSLYASMLVSRFLWVQQCILFYCGLWLCDHGRMLVTSRPPRLRSLWRTCSVASDASHLIFILPVIANVTKASMKISPHERFKGSKTSPQLFKLHVPVNQLFQGFGLLVG